MSDDLRASIERLAERWEAAAVSNERGDFGPDLVMASDAARVCAARLRQALGQQVDDPEAFTTIIEARTEWGVRRTWGDIGSVASDMSRRTAEKCARDWPGVLVSRTVTSSPWVAHEPQNRPLAASDARNEQSPAPDSGECICGAFPTEVCSPDCNDVYEQHLYTQATENEDKR